MPEPTIYLDYAAGTPVSEGVLLAGIEAARLVGNPSALHAAGRSAADRLAACRGELAKLLAVRPGSLIFTAGATEANNLVNLAVRRTYPRGKVAALQVDHDSQRLGADYVLGVDPRTGRLRAEDIAGLPADTCCLSVAGINNELGTIQPLAAVKRSLGRVRSERAAAGNDLPLLLHVDASQMALVHNVQPQALADADLVSFNGAKFYAFKQSGLLYVKPGSGLRPPFVGGGQESGFRPGSESVMLAAGLSLALAEVARQRSEAVRRLRELQAAFETRLRDLGGEAAGGRPQLRSPHISTVVFKGHDNESLALRLSQAGIFVGVGSACHSRSDLLETSALKALGYGREEIYSALRFSFGYETTAAELDRTAGVLAGLLGSEGADR